MQKLASKVLATDLVKDISAQAKQWTIDNGNIYMAFAPSSGIAEAIKKMPSVLQAIKELEEARKLPAVHVMINRMAGKTSSPFHTDPIKGNIGNVATIERWHLPVVTNLEASLVQDDGVHHMTVGSWHGPVRYWKSHRAVNGGTTDRLHIVVDLQGKVELGRYA